MSAVRIREKKVSAPAPPKRGGAPTPDPRPLAELKAALAAKAPVALMGAAGTGKSTLIQALAAELGLRVLKTASSHVAALVLGKSDGRTTQQIAYRAGLPPSAKNRQQLEKDLAAHQLLVVDEFPLLSAAQAGAALKAATDAGLAVVFSGDFLQLKSPSGDGVTPAWLDARGFRRVLLEKIHRAADPPTLELYRAIRQASSGGPEAVYAAAAELGVPQIDLQEFGVPGPGARAQPRVGQHLRRHSRYPRFDSR